MGVPVSRELEKSKQIEIYLLSEKKNQVSTIKLLLLGTACSGKSTVLKQMKILHCNGFSDEEIVMQKKAVFQNIVTSMCEILGAMKRYSLRFIDSECEAHAVVIMHYRQMLTDNNFFITVEIIQAWKRLWQDKHVRLCCELYNTNDSATYFFDNLDRISSSDYSPTEQDLLRCRIPTTGITEIEFAQKNYTLKMFDVGGLRSERRKWIHCFDNVDAVFYLASLTDYNMTLLEDNVTNRLTESVLLFNELSSCVYFKNADMILFLNKKDLFADRIKLFPLSHTFPDFMGLETYELSVNYIKDKYLRDQIGKKKIYTHTTCATDTRSVDVVFNACLDIILARLMKQTMLT